MWIIELRTWQPNPPVAEHLLEAALAFADLSRGGTYDPSTKKRADR